MKKLMIIGGSGYVGSLLIETLLSHNLKIFNYDISFFGDEHLPISNNFTYIKGDIRNHELLEKTLNENNIDTVIHLACISNDPTVILTKDIAEEINYLSFIDQFRVIKDSCVKKFIFASSASVYGISEDDNVTEENDLVPVSQYNIYKAKCEEIIQKNNQNKLQYIILRPATICGVSPKMRFDLTVNILTNFAFNKGFIKVFGGEQFRPNLHIKDMCRLYHKLIFEDWSSFNGKIFNVGFENLKVKQIAELIKKFIFENYKKKIEIKIEESFDNRSYRLNSNKIINEFNFKPQYSVLKAIEELCKQFDEGVYKNPFDKNYVNLEVLKNIDLKYK